MINSQGHLYAGFIELHSDTRTANDALLITHFVLLCTWADLDGGHRGHPKPMVGRSGRIRSVLLTLPVRFQNALNMH